MKIPFFLVVIACTFAVGFVWFNFALMLQDSLLPEYVQAFLALGMLCGLALTIWCSVIGICTLFGDWIDFS